MINENITPTSEKKADKVETGKRTVAFRKDFRAFKGIAQIDGRPSSNKRLADPLARSRDQLLGLAKDLMSPEDFMLLTVRSADKIRSLKHNTAKSLLSDLKSYLMFFQQHEMNQPEFSTGQTTPVALPASAVQLSNYIMQHRHRTKIITSDRGDKESIANPLSIDTLLRHVASIDRWHKELKFPKLSDQYEVRTTIETLKNHSDEMPRQMAPLNLEHITAAMGVMNPHVLRDAQDIALLVLAYESGLRRSNIIRINIEHLTFEEKKEPEQDAGTFLTVPRTKTSTDNKGKVKYLSSGATLILKNWLTLSGVTKGAVFRGVYSNNRLSVRVDSKTVANTFKRIAKRIDHPGALNIGGHSTRIGVAQDLAYRNVDLLSIMQVCDWTDPRMAIRYTREMEAKKKSVINLMQSEMSTAGSRFLLSES